MARACPAAGGIACSAAGAEGGEEATAEGSGCGREELRRRHREWTLSGEREGQNIETKMMARRLSTKLHRFAAAAYTSPIPPPLFRSSSALLSRPFDSNHTSKVFGSFSNHGMQYSTIVPDDPDTHEDFKPANKLESSELSLKDIVEQDVKEHPVMLYMKGVPDRPQCGFSSLAVRVLSEYDVPVGARNILEDPELKNAVKTYSMWPTFPQIFIKGAFVGGSDIILKMHQSGELQEKLKDVSANQKNSQ